MKYWTLTIGIALMVLLPILSGASQVNPAATQITAIQGEGLVVLGDVTFKIADDARFYGQDEQTSISLSNFNEGDWVEYSVNSEGRIDEMWLSSEFK